LNTDIRLQLSIRYHPKTKKLRARLGPPGVLGFVWLLMFAAENRPDGNLAGYDEEDLALASDYAGDPVEFVQVLEAVGFLDRIPGGWKLHDWKRNNPWAAGAEARSEKARKAAAARWGNEDEDAGEGEAETKKQRDKPEKDAPSIPRARSSNAPSPSPSPLPEGLAPKTWAEFEQHRREIGHKLTPTATRRIFLKLERFRDEHQVDPTEAVELSLDREWRGVFPERIVEERERRTGGQHERDRQGRGPASSRRAQAADEVRERIRAVP
jgi:hypothetical protein